MNYLKNGIFDKQMSKKLLTSPLTVLDARLDMPPNVKQLLAKYGNSPIKYIKINRQPVQSAILAMLNLFSKDRSRFNNEMDKLPYDTLYHLQMIFSTQAGRVVLETNERVNMSERPVEVDTIQINFPPNLTINQIYNNALQNVGAKTFYAYNASSNNCQNFVLNLLQYSNLGTPEALAFTKQNTKSLFEGDPRLRKIANTTTTLGSIGNVLMQGGKVRPKNKWIQHVKNYQKAHGCSYKEALTLSKDTYI